MPLVLLATDDRSSAVSVPVSFSMSQQETTSNGTVATGESGLLLAPLLPAGEANPSVALPPGFAGFAAGGLALPHLDLGDNLRIPVPRADAADGNGRNRPEPPPPAPRRGLPPGRATTSAGPSAAGSASETGVSAFIFGVRPMRRS